MMKALQKLAPLFVCAPLLGHAQTVQVSGSNRTLDLTVTEKVIQMADVATVHIGFITFGADKESAYTAGSVLSNGIMKALTSAGVPAVDVESESQAVTPVQPYELQQLPESEKAERKFQVTQSWTVRTTAEASAHILDVAVKAGANQSGQVDWSLRDENAADAEAASKALKHAQTSAAQLAESLHAKLGALLYASNEVQASPILPRPLPAAALMSRARKDEPLAINPRRLERSATIHAIFALE